MDKETAKSLAPLTSRANEDLLKIYAESRIEYLRKQLETATESEFLRLQGQVKEVRRLLTLKEEILKERS